MERRKEGRRGILKWRQDKRTGNRAYKNCRRDKRKDKRGDKRSRKAGRGGKNTKGGEKRKENGKVIKRKE